MFALLFSYYFAMSLKQKSIAQSPEKLYRDKKLIIIVTALIISLTILTFIEIPLAKRIVGINEGINYRPW